MRKAGLMSLTIRLPAEEHSALCAKKNRYPNQTAPLFVDECLDRAVKLDPFSRRRSRAKRRSAFLALRTIMVWSNLCCPQQLPPLVGHRPFESRARKTDVVRGCSRLREQR